MTPILSRPPARTAPVTAVVAVVAGLPVALTLPPVTVLAVAVPTIAAAAFTARYVARLAPAVHPRVAGLRAAATVLVLVGGPAVVAVELGPDAVPLLAVLCGLSVAAVPVLRSGPGSRHRPGPRNVAR